MHVDSRLSTQVDVEVTRALGSPSGAKAAPETESQVAEFIKLCEDVERMLGAHVSDTEFHDIVAYVARDRGIPMP